MMSDRLRSRMRDKSNTYCPVCEVAFQSRREFVHHSIIEHDVKVRIGWSGVRLNREKLLKKMKEDQSEVSKLYVLLVDWLLIGLGTTVLGRFFVSLGRK